MALRIEQCEHIISGERRRFMGVTHKPTNVRQDMCPLCFAQFVASKGHNPQAFIVGHHIYRSSDPNLPKDKWERLTKVPLQDPPFKDPPPPPGVNYYYFARVVNAYGLEGPPSNVIESGVGEWDFTADSNLEM